MQKCLTKGKVYGNICKLSQMRRCKYMEKQMEKNLKKVLEKVLTKLM